MHKINKIAKERGHTVLWIWTSASLWTEPIWTCVGSSETYSREQCNI